jgi:hypothetical protein
LQEQEALSPFSIEMELLLDTGELTLFGPTTIPELPFPEKPNYLNFIPIEE